jgi:hypothetical protein
MPLKARATSLAASVISLAPPASPLASPPAISPREEELVCLAWAASTRQLHKAAAPSMGEALRCAFDDPTMPPERVTTATLENVPCY